MTPIRGQENAPSREQPEITFSIIDSPAGSGELLNANATATIVDRDAHGVSLVTRIPVEPGNIVRLNQEGVSKVGVVMWSVESADQCRIQVRFI